MRILMFKRKSVCYDTMNIFSAIVGDYFQNRGIEVDYLDLNSICLEEEVKGLFLKSYDAAIAFNSLGQESYKVNGQYLFDYLKIPFYNYIVDHPLRHHHTLSTPLNNYYVICLDEDHVTYIKKCYPHIREAYMLPLGGMISDKKNEERCYPVTLTGSFYSLEEIEEKIGRLAEPYQTLTILLVQKMLEKSELTNEQALAVVLKENDIVMDQPAAFADLMAQTNLAGHYVNACVREEVVRKLIESGIELHIFGNGWEKMKVTDWRKTVLHGPVSYPETADIYQKSVMVLNTMPWFKNGMHDRIPTAMLNGAVCVTDESGYFQGRLHDGEDVLLYSLEALDALPEKIKGIENADKKRREIAENGKQRALQAATWERRCEQLLEIITGSSCKII